MKLKSARNRGTSINNKSRPSTTSSNEENATLGLVQTRLNQLKGAILTSQAGNCASLSNDECMGICEAILDSDDLVEALCDYLDLSSDEANYILNRAFQDHANGEEAQNPSSHADSNNENENDIEDDDSSIGIGSDISADADADAYIQDGECELCEREMKLSLHHLIPKCTWKSIKPRFLDATTPYQKGDMEKVKEILDLGNELPHGLSSKTFSSGIHIKLFLAGYTATLCRPCHSCIHGCFDNMELAERYNSVEKLLGDERIYKFCQWQNKQKPAGKFMRTNKKVI